MRISSIFLICLFVSGCVTSNASIKDSTPYPAEIVVPKGASLAIGEIDQIYAVSGYIDNELNICHQEGRALTCPKNTSGYPYYQFKCGTWKSNGNCNFWGDCDYITGLNLPLKDFKCPENSSRTLIFSEGVPKSVVCRSFHIQKVK